MKKVFLSLLCCGALNAWAEDIYNIEASVNNVSMTINGVAFAAKNYCPDYRFGDNVIFLTGDPDGNCTEAMLMNLRNNQACDVWCQQL